MELGHRQFLDKSEEALENEFDELNDLSDNQQWLQCCMNLLSSLFEQPY